MKRNLPVTQQEVEFKIGETIVSRTNLKGQITEVNQTFLDISGYAESELIGVQHNCIRHPDMPPAAFQDLWSTVKAGRPWTGIVKNRCKNGDHYWVRANVVPVTENGQIVEYLSVRRPISRKEISDAEAFYALLNSGNAPAPSLSDRIPKLSIKQRLHSIFIAAFALLAIAILMFGGEGGSNVFTMTALLMAFIYVSCHYLISHAVLQPINKMNAVFLSMAEGNYDDPIDIKREDEVGDFMRSTYRMQIKLGYDIDKEKYAGRTSARIKNALDVCNTNVMLADTDLNIVYMNDSVQKMFADCEEDLKPDLPDLDANNLMGQNVDVFHKNPQHQRAVLANLTDVYKARIETGGHTFDLVATPVINDGVRLGTVVEWDDITEALAKSEEEQRAAAENRRIRAALDCAGANVMMADNDRNIIYCNDAVTEMMTGNEQHFRKDLPQFDASKLLGTNIDTFHKNPAYQQQLLSSLTETYEGSTVLGGRSLVIKATPVFDEQNSRLGTVVEWVDRTAEVATQNEIDDIVQAAMAGDLSKRISTEDKEGFFESLGVKLNELQNTIEGVLGETASLLNALSQGDLTKNIAGDYQGLFAQLQADSNATVKKLTEVIGQITGSARSVVTGAGEIATGTNDLSQRTESQASSLEETAASMEQMTSSVKQSADNAQSSANLAEEAGVIAAQGGRVVSEAVKAMEEINKSSREIGDIIGVIDEIAFQTNLLALNAAVEAARAGDHGRGFAVVAGEVRSLAQRSASAAKDIKTLIGDSTRKVEEGADLVNKSGDTLSKIVSSVQEVNAAIRGISEAAGEQSDGIAQVNIAVTQMDEMTQQNAALVEETSAASRTMSDEANQMLKLIQFFTVAGGSQRVSPASASIAAQTASVAPRAVAEPVVSPVSSNSPASFNAEDDWAEF